MTATAGIALTFAAADITARRPTYAALAIALVLLAESFGRDVLWLGVTADADRYSVPGSTERSLDASSARLRLP